MYFWFVFITYVSAFLLISALLLLSYLKLKKLKKCMSLFFLQKKTRIQRNFIVTLFDKKHFIGQTNILNEDTRDSRKGYVITNNHVVEDMDEITVRLLDKMEYDATIVGRDPKTDIAVLQINAKGLKDLEFGDSDKLRVG